MDVHERIKAERLKNNLTLLDVASALKVTDATVQRYESGAIKIIAPDTIKQLSDLFHCSPSYLIGWEDIQSENEVLDIHKKIKKRREELGLSINDIASALNISRATVYRYEDGSINKIPANLLAPLSELLQCSPTYLMDSNQLNSDVGRKIKQMRKARHWPLEKVASMIGTTKSTVSKWERGVISNMGQDKIATLSVIFGVSPSVILGWEECESSSNEINMKPYSALLNQLNKKGQKEALKRLKELTELSVYRKEDNNGSSEI